MLSNHIKYYLVNVILLILNQYHVWSQRTVVEGIFKLLQEGTSQLYNEPPNANSILPVYDFIIVGAGTAGCVIANRLTENPKWKVLLIEAGNAENYLMDIPMMAAYLQFTASNWAYKTMPSDKYCLGLDNAQCNWPRGKVIGGSSVLNYMIYTRGNRRDFDAWEAMGNPGWSYKDVLHYFKKVENFTIQELFDPKYHARNGYVNVGYSPYRSKVAEALVQANIEMGLNYTDYNGRTQIGVSYLQTTLKDGIRHSSSRAYLHPIKYRPNLYVKKMAMVSKILIDPQTKETYGVELILNNKRISVNASKEVIISGGSINSPQLLMLSGIGPKKHLQNLNITVVQNAKVGYNLMDHIAVGGLIFTVEEPNYTLRFDHFFSRLGEFLNYHQGPITIAGGCEVISFHDLKNSENPDGYPDMELLYTGTSITEDISLHRNFGVKKEIFNEVYGNIMNKDTYMVFPMLLKPKSKGRIMLRDSKYTSKPLIYANYFAKREDMDTIIEGAKLAMNVSQQPTMKKLGAKLHNVPIPSCKIYTFGSDSYFECLARQFTFTIYHQSGTCKMGPRTDKYAVVDPRLRVHGVRKLRVVDASIMPDIPAGHINAPVYMIAEKAADMIKEDWGFYHGIKRT